MQTGFCFNLANQKAAEHSHLICIFKFVIASS